MTDLERQCEKATARIAHLEEENEAAVAQITELTAQVSSLTADVAAAKNEVVLYQADLEAAEVSEPEFGGCLPVWVSHGLWPCVTHCTGDGRQTQIKGCTVQHSIQWLKP